MGIHFDDLLVWQLSDKLRKMYKQIFNQCCNEFKVNVGQKLREHNNFRIEEDVIKKVQNYPIHREIFRNCYMEGELKTLRMVCSVFGGKSCLKINQHKDLSVIAPQYYMSTCHSSLCRGDLIFPISKLFPSDSDPAEKYCVFVPSSSSDETESNSIPLSSLLPFDPDVLPEERHVHGEGFNLSTVKGDNYASVKSGHNLSVGDYLVVRGKNYKIRDIHPDDCFARVEGSRNMIYVTEPFANNVKRQIFRFRKMIWLKGQLIDVPAVKIHSYHPVQIYFKEKKKKIEHGVMDLSFSCSVFNASGFYTRCLAIPEADL